MQYLLSEEEYQRYQDTLKDAEAYRSDAAKMDAYAAARDVRMLTAPEIPKCFDCGATEIADVCPECFKPFCANCVEKDENCCDK